MSAVMDTAWLVVQLFAPLVYIAILGRRDEPTQRLVAFVRAVTALVEAVMSAFRSGGPR